MHHTITQAGSQLAWLKIKEVLNDRKSAIHLIAWGRVYGRRKHSNKVFVDALLEICFCIWQHLTW